MPDKTDVINVLSTCTLFTNGSWVLSTCKLSHFCNILRCSLLKNAKWPKCTKHGRKMETQGKEILPKVTVNHSTAERTLLS